MRVNTVELAHADRKVRLGRLHQQVIMIAHHDIGMEFEAETVDQFREQLPPVPPFGFLMVDGLSVNAASSDMIPNIGSIDS